MKILTFNNEGEFIKAIYDYKVLYGNERKVFYDPSMLDSPFRIQKYNGESEPINSLGLQLYYFNWYTQPAKKFTANK
jgi:hypothetical protein